MDYRLMYGGFTISFFCDAPGPDDIKELVDLGELAGYKLNIWEIPEVAR